MGFQLYKKDNLIKIYPRVCPHEGGDLDINNEVGIRYTKNKFIDKKCRMRCNIHNRFLIQELKLILRVQIKIIHLMYMILF